MLQMKWLCSGPKKVAKRMRRRDQRLKDYLNSPDDDGKSSAQIPKITSKINEPPPQAALPPVENDPNAQQKGGKPHAPEAPEIEEHKG